MSYEIKLDMKKLEKLIKEFPDAVDDGIGKLAIDTTAEIGLNWSSSSPSAPGDPPGVVTGNLKNNIDAVKIEQFYWQVRAKTKYAADLEFGTVHMAARPFMLPAAKRVMKGAPKEFKARIEKIVK